MKKKRGILQWIIGAIFILAGLGSFNDSIAYAICMTLFGISFLPMVWEALKGMRKKWVKYVIPVALFLMCCFTVPTVESKEIDDKKPVAAQVNAEKEEIKKTTVKEEKKTEEKPAKKAEKTEKAPAVPKPKQEPVIEDMTVHFLDVGQGLSIFVQAGEQNLIYDGGNQNKSSFVVAYLKEHGVETIDYLISSHYDSDHVSGLIGCLNAFDVKNVIGSNYVHDSKTYESFVNMADSKGLSIQYPAVGEEFAFGTGKFVILAPETVKESDSNDNSVAIKLVNGDNSFIFTGDAESGSESAMCQSGIELDCDVLVPGHHGSATATSWDFLQKTVPEYAVISCGKDNQYGHPDKDTMDKLQSMDIQIFRTDLQETIIVTSNGTDLKWSVEPCNDYSPGSVEDTGTQAQEEVTQAAVETQPPAPETPQEVQPPAQTEMVWIPATGEKYHNKPNCGRMNPNTARQISRADAEASGYEACKKCY